MVEVPALLRNLAGVIWVVALIVAECNGLLSSARVAGMVYCDRMAALLSRIDSVSSFSSLLLKKISLKKKR